MCLQVPLNPIDNVLAALDHTLQRQDGIGFNCVLTLMLEGELNRGRLIDAARRLGECHVLTRARLHKPRWARHPRWVVEPAATIPIEFEEATADTEPAPLAETILNRKLDPRDDPPVQIFARRLQSGCHVLILKWSHVLTDGRGGDFLLQALGRYYAGLDPSPPRPTPRPEGLSVGQPKPRWPRPPACSVNLCRLWGAPSANRLRLRVVALDEAESAALRRHATAVAGFGRQGIAMLGAAFRLMQRQALAADYRHATVRAHWPVALREGALPASLPGNEFGFVYLERPVNEHLDDAALAEQLTREIIDQLRRGEHRRAWVLARWLWLYRYARLCKLNDRSRFLIRGDRSTMHFRYAGRLIGGAREWGGLPVRGGFAATICWPEKPLALGLSETAGRFHVGVTWLEGALTDQAADQLIHQFRQEL
ncbi:MAG: hypothetical protein HY718_00555 [Planctomycetes bacterium]|nr:hypothetical protein [Planctomycetota bacterium]